VFAVETRGSQRHDEVRYRAGDAFLFGRETAGLSTETLANWPGERLIRLPMVPGNRSLNLSNAIAVVVFEAWRQLGFEGGR
jgi:tRNA (cytidine/uridine-2'-O-)-methyltransferase